MPARDKKSGNLRREGVSNHHHQAGSRSAIAILTTNSINDVTELCTALKSLKHLKGDKASPVLIFNEGNFMADQFYFLSQCTERTVAFPLVHLNGHFPKRFDPLKEWLDFQKGIGKGFAPMKDRDNWSYAQMIRFWTVGIWKHPAIQQYDTIMRIDTDSCFLPAKQDVELPSLMQQSIDTLPDLQPSYVYQSFESPPSYNTYVQGLYEFAVQFMEKENIKPSHPELWARAEELWKADQNVPLFKTNFEVSRVSFFQREDVMKWHESLSEFEPFGIWRKRWGDAHTRFLTMAMFGTPDSVSILNLNSGFYQHGRGKCTSFKVEK